MNKLSASICLSDRRFFWCCVLASLLACFVAAWRLDQPGLYYDEILFVNAALGGKTNNFVNARFFGIPLLLMDYMGALKAWFYAPIFSIFSVRPWSARLPAIFFGLAGTLLATLVMRQWFGRRAALIALALTIFDPTILTLSRLDWGSNAFMFFIRGALLFGLAKWTITPTLPQAWFIFACLTVGLFEKLSFLWLAGGTLCATAFIYGRVLLQACRKDHNQAIAWGLSVAVTGIAALRAVRLSHKMFDGAPFDLATRLADAWHLFLLTWSGGGALYCVIGDGGRFAVWFAVPVLGCLIVSLAGAYFFFRNNAAHVGRWTFVLVFALGTALLFTLTKGATGPHHSSVLSGLWQLVFVPFLATLLPSVRLRPLAVAAVAIGSAGMLMVPLLTVRCLVTEVPQINWDDSNWRLGQYLAAHPRDRFIITDWGIGNHAIAVARGAENFEDCWSNFTDLREAEKLVRAESIKGSCSYVFRPAAFATFKETESNLRAALTPVGLHTET